MFCPAVGREEHCKQISLACVGSARSVSATLGLHPHTACVLSWSTLLRLPVALQENCLKWSLGCVHFLGTPQRHRLGWVCVLCPSQVRAAQATRCLASTLSPGGIPPYASPVPATRFPWCVVGMPSTGVLCVSSRELIPGCNHPSGCQLSRIPGSLG